ncbi:terminase small subunit [Planococcus alpniumensis]|uniref:terminase small subunit n=1 Tax=Planococcus alpniumensis TaxID=2708345 RepID=UPI002011179B|nr:terminase small subunit [Planococcus sp. MSAK28401]
MVKLTVKQQRFADEYIRLGEITQAAVNAGYNPKSAYKTGSENLRKPLIESYINRSMEKLKKEYLAEQDEVL